jgi:hypothetical protein
VFDHPCWALDEQQHSVRVVYQWNEDVQELESQIYDLTYSDESHISSCNLVFLIPENADGTEQYYVYYNDEETSAPGYPDHVSLEDSYYFYEPIPGYPLESHFYKITQDGSIVYAVAQEGEFLWYTTSQCVTKLMEGTTEMMPKKGEAIASFDFCYYYNDPMSAYYSTSQQLISKEILCDGTLMVSCSIVSQSTDQTLETTAVYKYYYCPTSYKRVQTHVTHKALKDCTIYPETNTDGSYASLQCGGIHSKSIPDLNFGELYPYLHVATEHDAVEQYRVDLNPEYIQEDPVVHLISTTDDVDVGTSGWASFDEGTTGRVHALIFGSTSVLNAGDDERDGVQLKAYESDYPHLPGLENDVAAFQFTRNSYETSDSQTDLVIPAGFVAEYDAEFFSSLTGGYPLVEKEAAFFQSLVSIKPSSETDSSAEKNETEKYALTVFVHRASSIPLGSELAVLTGYDFPYITVELYQKEGFVCSGTAVRLPLRSQSGSEDATFRERLIAAIRIFDVHNLTVFKKIRFEELESGRYLIKVFKENPLRRGDRQYIGYTIVDLTQDTETRVSCTLQGSCLVSVIDQQGNGVSGAQVLFTNNDMIIAENTTDDKGFALLTAPCGLREQYQLTIRYDGFVVDDESIRFGYGRTLFPLKKSLELSQYDWSLKLVDTWGLPPEIEVTPRLTSKEMETPAMIHAEQHGDDTYQFTRLVSATYQLQIQYKSFLVEKEIQIPADKSLFVMPAEFPITLHVLDARGIEITDATIQFERGGKTMETTSNSSGTVVLLPPGIYQVTILSNGNVIGQRPLNVIGERSVDFITIQEPMFPLIIIITMLILVLIALAGSIVKKEPMYFLTILTIGLIVVALIFPWWILSGSSSEIQTSSTMFLSPLELVTTTKTSQVIAGELSYFPDLFITVMFLIPALTALGCFLILISLVSNRINKKRVSILLLISALFLFIGSLVMFSVAMSTFAEVGVGSFLGEGTLTFSIPGDETVSPVFCHWGPGSGFYMYGLSIAILFSTLLITLKKRKQR